MPPTLQEVSGVSGSKFRTWVAEVSFPPERLSDPSFRQGLLLRLKIEFNKHKGLLAGIWWATPQAATSGEADAAAADVETAREVEIEDISSTHSAMEDDDDDKEDQGNEEDEEEEHERSVGASGAAPRCAAPFSLVLHLQSDEQSCNVKSKLQTVLKGIQQELQAPIPLQMEPFCRYHCELMGFLPMPLIDEEDEGVKQGHEDEILRRTYCPGAKGSRTEIRAAYWAEWEAKNQQALMVRPVPRVEWILDEPPALHMVSKKNFSESLKLKWCLLRSQDFLMNSMPSFEGHLLRFWRLYDEISHEKNTSNRIGSCITTFKGHVESKTKKKIEMLPEAAKQLIRNESSDSTSPCAKEGCVKMRKLKTMMLMDPDLLMVLQGGPHGQYCSLECAAGRCRGCTAELNAEQRCSMNCKNERGSSARNMTLREYTLLLCDFESPSQAKRLKDELKQQDKADRATGVKMLKNDTPMTSFAPNWGGHREILSDLYWG